MCVTRWLLRARLLPVMPFDVHVPMTFAPQVDPMARPFQTTLSGFPLLAGSLM
jgi:hypothetical protein